MSIIRQAGGNNRVGHSQGGNDHYAETDQRGNNNISAIAQADQDNSGTVAQTGNNHFVSLIQGVNEFGAGNPQGGENNIASVTQNGTNLSADLSQAVETFGQGPADDNLMTVTMTGIRNSARVFQLSRGNVARNSVSGGGLTAAGGSLGNSSSILQNNPFYRQNANGQLEAPSGDGGAIPVPPPTNNPFSGNVADAAVTGLRNSSSVQQNGVLNRATVSMLGGGAGTTGDTSTGTPATNPGNFGPSGQRLPANRKQGNDSRIDQTGLGNVAAVSVGGLGGQGNLSLIDQGTTTSNPATLGVSHTAFLWQRGILDQSIILQDNNSRGPNGRVQAGSYVDVSQRSLNSTSYVEQVGTNSATISQGTGTATGDNSIRVRQQDAGDVASAGTGGIFDDPATATVVARNTAAVSQAGIDNGITVDQDARSATAIVWQQNGSRQNRVEIEQGTGRQTAEQNQGQLNQTNDPFGPREVGSQGGFLAQNTTDANDSSVIPVDVEETGAGTVNVTADVTQSGRGSRARARQDGQNLSAFVTQSGTRTDSSGVAVNSTNFLGISQISSLNSATVHQSGFNNSATVDQRGSGEAGSANNDGVTRRNLVTIQQTGNDNRALARQVAAVRPSGASSPAAGPAAGDPNPGAFRFARAAGLSRLRSRSSSVAVPT